MSHLADKRIVLCVTGSIAAYKVAFLTRLLVKQGAEVRIVMTPAAADFITPLTLSTLSKHEVHTDISDGHSWNNHVELGLWADALVVAPCTANTLGKMANGIADNMVMATYLSAKCPVYIAPAMDLDMWKHPSTKRNLDLLESYGNHLLPVGNGELASGLSGEGRMAEPEEIVAYLSKSLSTTQDMAGRRVVVTAGPTYEALDPVRFIGNHSSGKMGVEIAKAFASRGAEVELVLGPSALQPTHPKINLHRIQSAEDMYQAVAAQYDDCHAAIFAAAVADYRPASKSDKKIKKADSDLSIQLARTKDIAALMGQRKQSGQINVGFALETNDEAKNAQRKLDKKNFDLIVLNSLRDKGAGFKHDTNKVTLYDRKGNVNDLPLMSKSKVASAIADRVAALWS